MWNCKKLDKNSIVNHSSVKVKVILPVNLPNACYIATAIYGSYDCPQVWTLRRYRDDNLSKTRCGRVFIKVYYSISPTLVKWFGKSEWFREFWKPKLDNIVEKLDHRGIESITYEDK